MSGASPSLKRYLVLSIILLVMVGFVLKMGRRPSGNGGSDPPSIANSGHPSGSSTVLPAPIVEKSPTSPGAPGMKEEQTEIARLLARALDALRRGKQADADEALAQLTRIFGSGRDHAQSDIAAILEFLRSGQDAPTGKGFVVGKGGILDESTTLRVYLMDQLGRLSREAGSSAAADVARETLQQFGSPDEWAISMRNVAWLDPESRGFLQDRVNAMIHHAEWRDQPSAGMLEAFDVIVHSGAMVTVPELSQWVTATDSPLARASGVALDRLAASSALDLTTLLNRQPDLLSAAPLERADLFAHADLANAEQRAQLENYLLRSDVGLRERKKFFSGLIQTGRFVSNNLLTPYVPPETPEEAGARLETLTKTINGWMREPRFAPLSGELAALGNKVNRIVDEMDADGK